MGPKGVFLSVYLCAVKPFAMFLFCSSKGVINKQYCYHFDLHIIRLHA